MEPSSAAPARDVEKQFEALRDGDRFFSANDPELDRIQHALRHHVQGHSLPADQARRGRDASNLTLFKLADLNQPAPHEKRLHGHRRAHPPFALGPPGRH